MNLTAVCGTLGRCRGENCLARGHQSVVVRRFRGARGLVLRSGDARDGEGAGVCRGVRGCTGLYRGVQPDDVSRYLTRYRPEGRIRGTE